MRETKEKTCIFLERCIYQVHVCVCVCVCLGVFAC